MIICGGLAMAEHAKKRVEDYALESDFETPVEILDHTPKIEGVAEI